MRHEPSSSLDHARLRDKRELKRIPAIFCRGNTAMKTYLPFIAYTSLAQGMMMEEETSYRMEVSFPVQHPLAVDSNDDLSLGNRRQIYLDHLEGCREAYPGTKCDEFEYFRLMMNNRQPQSINNYTDTGFLKIRAPQDVQKLIDKFWSKNMYKGVREN